MGDEDIVLRPFEKPQPPNRRFQTPGKLKLKPVVQVRKSEPPWASWNKPPQQASSKPIEHSEPIEHRKPIENSKPIEHSIPIEQPASKPVVVKHTTPQAVGGSNSPGLNLKHGFIRNIRHRISKNLTKESQDSKDDKATTNRSDQLHATELKLCSSGKREDLSKTSGRDLHEESNTKLKTPGTNTVRTEEAEPKRPVTREVSVNQRVFGPRKAMPEVARSKSDPCVSVDAGDANTKSERPRRRRPSLQIYQPPGRRHQGADSVLGEIESYERRGMTSGDDDVRTASPLDPIMSHTATDPEVAGLGMPLRRTLAKTNLTNSNKEQDPHTKNKLLVTINKNKNPANSWSWKTNRRVVLSEDSSVSKVSSLVECNGETSDANNDAAKPLENKLTVTLEKTRSLPNSWSCKTNRRVILSVDSSVSDISSPIPCNGESLNGDSGATKSTTPTKTSDNSRKDNLGILPVVTNGSANSTASSDSPSGDICAKFSYLEQMFQLDVTLSEVDVKGYPDWAQRYVFEAYHDPKLVSEEILAEIGRLIAERAWAEEEQDNYRRTAARLCQRIAKKEYDNEETLASGQSLPFQRGILDGCYKTFQRRRLQTRDTWRTYATFCSDLLRRLHFGSVPPKVLCTLVLNLLEQFMPTLLDSPAEVETVAEMLARCGPQLEVDDMARLEMYIDQLVTNLLTSTDPVIKLNVGLIQEMYAGGWFLSRARRAYYMNS